MSLVDVERTFPAISDTHDPQSPQVIDVDLLDTEDAVRPPPRQRRRVEENGRSIPIAQEVIAIPDSDDDSEVQFIGSRRSTRRRPPTPVPRERIFSPLPSPQVGSAPPVPPIPDRFLPQLRHFRPLPPFDAPIIANDLHFPFEANIRPNSRREEDRQPENVPAAAPPLHHLPSMGLGGALVAGVSHIFGPRRGSASSYPQLHTNIPTFTMRWNPLDLFGDVGQADFDDFENNFAVNGVRGALEREFERRGRPRPPEPDYKPEYTHPNNLTLGFTPDFAPGSSDSATPSDDSGIASSSRSGESTLVCTHCHDPLILGASDIREGRDERRLWGLRCGHLLDGKCIKKLMQPATQVVHSHLPDVKGKAKMEPGIPDMPLQDQEKPLTEAASPNSIRSRLRSHRGLLESGSRPSQPDVAPVPQRPSATWAKTPYNGHRGKGKGKGKGRTKVRVEHEWICPVSGCGHTHVSVFEEGRWIMDGKRGAIAVFV